eukprot:CFRG4015T1
MISATDKRSLGMEAPVFECDKENKAPQQHVEKGRVQNRKPFQGLLDASASVCKSPSRQPLTQTVAPTNNGNRKHHQQRQTLNGVDNRVQNGNSWDAYNYDEHTCSLALISLAQQEPITDHTTREENIDWEVSNQMYNNGQKIYRPRKPATTPSALRSNPRLFNHLITPIRPKKLIPVRQHIASAVKGTPRNNSSIRTTTCYSPRRPPVMLREKFCVTKMPRHKVKRPDPRQRLAIKIYFA